MLGIDALVLLLESSELSISYHEAEMLYGGFSFLQFIENLSFAVFGKSDFALRFPMVVFHISSFILLYKISQRYLKHERDRLWLMFVFILLPGVISSAVLVDNAGFVIFALLFLVYIYEKVSIGYIYVLLSLYLFIDGDFAYLFFALIFFSLHKRDKKFLFFNVVLFLSSMYLFGINTEGLPKGHFLDAMGLYAAIFTPIVFVYIFYILYRKYLTKDIDLLWFISAVALVLSLLLSFRQRIDIESFAPYLIVSLPLAAQTFSNSYRVRLKMFRTKYKAVFSISIIFLLLNSSLVFFNKNLYPLLDKPQMHFAYKLHVAKELASKLKDMGIECVDTKKHMQLRLRFYDIAKCDTYLLSKNEINKNTSTNVTISYNNKPVYSASVTKINKK